MSIYKRRKWNATLHFSPPNIGTYGIYVLIPQHEGSDPHISHGKEVEVVLTPS